MSEIDRLEAENALLRDIIRAIVRVNDSDDGALGDVHAALGERAEALLAEVLRG